MSFKVAGHTSLVCDKSVIERTALSMGWTVECNTTIRAHDIAVGEKFDVVLKNPSEGHRSYDVGIRYSKDNKTAEFVYDKWGGSVEEQLGVNCGKFKNTCAVAAIHENDVEQGHLSFDEYFETFCKWEDDGSLVYNGYDDEDWVDTEKGVV